MKKLVFTLLLSATSLPTWAQQDQNELQDTAKSTPLTQEKEKHKVPLRRPNAAPIQLPNYGGLAIDWGFSFLRDSPQAMELSPLGSRFVNVAGYYNIRLGQSPFAIGLGIGTGFDGYRLAEQNETYNTLVRDESSRHTALQDARGTLPEKPDILQSTLNPKYFDLSVEAKFNANRRYPKESFFFAIGGRLGMFLNAYTTVKYKEDEQTKQRTTWESFNLNQMRYGVYVRVGWRRFSLFYQHILSPFFKEGEGPNNNTMPSSVGLSVDLF